MSQRLNTLSCTHPSWINESVDRVDSSDRWFDRVTTYTKRECASCGLREKISALQILPIEVPQDQAA